MEYQTRQGSQPLKTLLHWAKSRDMEKHRQIGTLNNRSFNQYFEQSEKG